MAQYLTENDTTMTAIEILPPVDHTAIPMAGAGRGPAVSMAVARRLAPWWRALERNAPHNTVRAMRSDSRHYISWCWGQGLVAVPAIPETVATYLRILEEAGAGYSTLQRRRATISSLHKAAGVPNPAADPIVGLEQKGAALRLGRRSRQARGLRWDDLNEVLSAIGKGGTAIDLRDAALMAVGYDTLKRRSELVSLRIGDLVFEKDGSGRALFRRLKGDDGRGKWKWLAEDTVIRLRAWLEVRERLWRTAERETRRALAAPDARGKRKASLEASLEQILKARDMVWTTIGFNKLLRTHGSLLGPLACAGSDSGKRVAEIFKERAGAIGIVGSDVADEAAISGHSLRVGAAQDLYANGASIPELQGAGDWRSATMPVHYGERIAAGDGAMARLADKMGRRRPPAQT